MPEHFLWERHTSDSMFEELDSIEREGGKKLNPTYILTEHFEAREILLEAALFVALIRKYTRQRT
jgi:hypothetical protein